MRGQRRGSVGGRDKGSLGEQQQWEPFDLVFVGLKRCMRGIIITIPNEQVQMSSHMRRVHS